MSKKVVITGASSGIGRAIALKYAMQDFDIAISCDKNDKELSNASMEIKALGRKCITYVGDMGDYREVSKMRDMILSDWHDIDVLINNAGISYVGLLQDMTLDDWNHVIRSNLDSVFNCTHAFLPDMISKHSGRIINISSVWGIVGASCEVAYSASKGGVNAFTKALAKEVALSGITVNAIACGMIDTAMNDRYDDKDKKDIIDDIPIGRIATAREVACIAYALSEMPSYLTGQIIGFDGGWKL